MRVGVIGATGLMGHGIAKNVQAKGYDLSFTLRSESDRVADLRAAGATQAGDNAELGATCDAVIICITTAEDVAQVVAGPNGLLTNPKDGLIVIDTSTSEPSTTARLAAECEAKGVTFVDAPLTLGPQQAEDGTLNVIVGASDEVFEQVKPIIETFAAKILHPGGTGAGHVLKLINNFAVMTAVATLSEAFAVAAKSDLDPQSVVDILSVGTMNSLLLQNVGQTLHGDYSRMTFALDNAKKDLRYFARLAGELGVTVPVGDGAFEVFNLASRMGFGDEYVPSVVKGQAKLNDIEISARSAKSES